jgi:hypothetical protein
MGVGMSADGGGSRGNGMIPNMGGRPGLGTSDGNDINSDNAGTNLTSGPVGGFKQESGGAGEGGDGGTRDGDDGNIISSTGV